MNSDTIQGQIIRPFSPAIGKYKLPNETISLINTHVDGILKDQNKIDVCKSQILEFVKEKKIISRIEDFNKGN